MRFIAKYGSFAVEIVKQESEAYANGAVRIIKPSAVAQFKIGMLTPIEREMALTHWTFNGSYQEMDEATTVPPDYRIGVFDTELAQLEKGWSDEIRAEVEDELCAYADQSNDIIVVRSMVPPPWPRYDDFRGTPTQLVRKLVEDGHDLDAVLTYERDHQRRPKVLDEIAKAITTGTVEIEAEEEVIG